MQYFMHIQSKKILSFQGHEWFNPFGNVSYVKIGFGFRTIRFTNNILEQIKLENRGCTIICTNHVRNMTDIIPVRLCLLLCVRVSVTNMVALR